MKVSYDNKVFIVGFKKDSIYPKRGDMSRELIQTTCHIKEMKGSQRDLVAIASSRQNYKDKSNDITGRKIAFTKAVSIFSKNKRTAFWEEYLKNIRIANRHKTQNQNAEKHLI